jgi:hypothetical protein
MACVANSQVARSNNYRDCWFVYKISKLSERTTYNKMLICFMCQTNVQKYMLQNISGQVNPSEQDPGHCTFTNNERTKSLFLMFQGSFCVR